MKNKDFWNNSKIVRLFSTDRPSTELKKLLKTYGSPGKTKALDLGCGGGRNTRLLVDLDFDTYACDLYTEMLKETRKKIASRWTFAKRQKRIVRASIIDLPYKNNFFDLIVSNGVYHQAHSLHAYEKALEESARVLKPGGLLYLNVFTDKLITQDLITIAKNRCVYLTKDGLKMTLLSRKKIIELFKKYKIFLKYIISEQNINIGLGKRSVLKAVLIKIRH